MNSTQTNPSARCPACLKHADGATALTATPKPKPDDLAICFYCGNIATYKQDLTLRSITPKEFEEFPPELQDKLTRACGAIHRSK